MFLKKIAFWVHIAPSDIILMALDGTRYNFSGILPNIMLTNVKTIAFDKKLRLSRKRKYIFSEIAMFLGLEPTCWQDFQIILHGFVWRSLKTG